MRPGRLKLLFACLILTLACSRTDSGHGRVRAGGAGEPQFGGTLRVPVAADPTPMNPLLARRSPFDLWRCFYPSLVISEARGARPAEVRGDLARRWAWSDEAHALVLVLRTDRFWQDTVRVRSADVVRTFEAYRSVGRFSDKAAADSLDTGLVAMEALDDSTVRARFRPGFPLWKIWPVLGWPILPAHKLPDPRPEFLAASPLAREPLSAGAFRLLDWRPGLNLWLGPNPSARRPPWLRRVAFEPCPGADARILRLVMGGADVVTDVPVYRLASLVDPNAIVQVHREGIGSVEMIFWNLHHPVATAALREAIAYGIDRDRLADALLSWRGERYGGPAGGLLDPGKSAGVEVEVGTRGSGRSAAPAGTGAEASGPGNTIATVSAPSDSARNPAPASPAAEAESTAAMNDSAAPRLSGPAASSDLVSPESAAASRRDSLLALSSLPYYDPARANHILDEAGWIGRDENGMRVRAGQPLRVEILYDRSNEFRERIITYLEEDFSRLGITLVPVPLDGSSVWKRFRSGIFHTALLGFRPPAVPDLSSLWASWGMYNGGGYASMRADSLIQAQQAATNPDEIERLGRRLEAQVRRDRPVEFLIYRETVDLLSERVRDFRGTVYEPFAGLSETWLADTTSVAPESVNVVKKATRRGR